MKNTLKIIPVVGLLAACGGARAGAQPQGPEGADRIHMYQVAPDAAAPAAVQAAQQGFIEVSGTGLVTVDADVAHISFTVETRAATAGEAASSNATLMTSVLAAIRDGGTPSLRVETFGYSLRPDYTRADADRPATISSYAASNNIRVTLDDVGAVGRILDIAIGAGANRVSSLSFSASDTEAAEAEALTAAVNDARRQASTIATALGRQLGPVIEVFTGSRPSARPMAETQFRAMATPIEPGDQSVSATVTVRYAIGTEIGRR